MALPAWARHWRWWGTGLIAAALLIRGTFWATHGTLWLVNGLQVPVRVSVGGQVVEVAPSGLSSLRLPSGSHSLEAVTEDGKGREALQVAVPSWGGTAVYSVAGAALLYTVKVFYAKTRGEAPDPQQQLLCGQRTFVPDVDLYFQEPPESVSMSKSQRVASRTSLLMANGGWEACVAALGGEGKERAAAALIAAVRALTPGEALLSAEVRVRSSAGDQGGAVQLASAQKPPSPVTKKPAAPPAPQLPQYRLVREEGVTLQREP